jgi:hypothetical protein
MPTTEQDLRTREDEEKQFTQVFNEAARGDGKADAMTTPLTQWITPLGDHLRTMFNEYEIDRRDKELDFIKDLRQYRGEYDPYTLKRMNPKRSKAFLGLTRTKVNTVTSRQTDLLFPANKEKNWGIDPTPVPELNPAIIQNIVEQYIAQTGDDSIDEEFIKKELNKEAQKRSDAMEAEMEDQLAELKYRDIIRSVMKDGHIYGTGILKGPLVKQRRVKRWLPGPDGEWVTIHLDTLSPWCEHVSIWDYYPDMSSRTPENMRGSFQRHVKSRQRVLELANREDFNGEAIKAYLKLYPDGDAQYKNHENDLRSLNLSATERTTGYKETTTAGTSHIGSDGKGIYKRRAKYEMLEYWGYMDTAKLAEADIEVPEDMGPDVAVNMWLLGPVVVKAVISNIEAAEIPYHMYYYEKDDTSIWGDGIPKIMRDIQKLFNGAVRAMLDNAAISAGPIVEVNVDLLAADENPRDLYPFRVFAREGTGMDASAQAVRVFNVDTHTNEFMAMIGFFQTAADEITTIPRYMYGDSQKIGGAGKTASGLSMLMGAANITLKDQVKNFDEGITKPFIKGLYFWNMEFNDKEHIKGDFNIQARGSTSLIAREVKLESLHQFLALTANEIDMMYTRRDNVLRAIVKAMDLDDMELIKDKNTVEIEERHRADQQAADKKFMQDLAMLKAQSGGHVEGELTPGLGVPDQGDLVEEGQV